MGVGRDRIEGPRVGGWVDVAVVVLLGLPQHMPVALCYCLLLLGIATSSFVAPLLMIRIMPAARAAAVSFTGDAVGGWRGGWKCVRCH